MKITEIIKRRVHRFFHPTLEDCIRRFSTNSDWAFEDLDRWEKRFDKIFRFSGRDKKE